MLSLYHLGAERDAPILDEMEIWVAGLYEEDILLAMNLRVIVKRALWICVVAPAVGCFLGCRTSSPPLRVLTYNIHHGEGTDGRLDLSRIAEVIRSANPDLVALQEVDNRTERTGMVDQAGELGKLTGLHAAFGKALDYSGGEYGAAILSRWPFEEIRPEVLPASPGHETRPALIAAVKPGRRAAALSFVSIHFDHLSERERLAQAERLLELLEPKRGSPIILAGDFNAVPESEVMQLFRSDWMNATAGEERFTIPSGGPRRQIDFILFRPRDRWRVVETRVLDSNASDHCALLVVLGPAE